jgi:hypothetical protein
VTHTELDLFALFLSANMAASTSGARQTIAASTAKLLVRVAKGLPAAGAGGAAISAPLWQRHPVRWLLLQCEAGLQAGSAYQV